MSRESDPAVPARPGIFWPPGGALNARLSPASLSSAGRSLSLRFSLFLLLLPPPPVLPSDPRAPTPVNPCCYYPCQHQGICVRFGLDSYQCDCTRTGYSGPNCTIPELWTWLRNTLRPSPSFVHYLLTHGHWFWEFVNSTFIRDLLMRLVLTVRSNLIPSPPTYNLAHDYISWESFSNVSYYTRILPSVPEDCPTPMGTKGKKQLPDAQLLSHRFLLRRKFIPDPQGTNLMFAFFAQHFTHQFFKTSGKMGPGFTKALGHGVDLGHIYGDNLERQYQLRLFKDGKLKYQVLDGEMYPPSVEETNVLMHYPRGVLPQSQMAVGQEVFGLLPGLMLYATIWLREHNRVCDLLKAEHPTWGDEQLFQTTRLILIGETIRIVIEEYVQQLSGYFLQLKFDPELLFNVHFQYRNRIALEFNQLYHWHPLMPDAFQVGSQEYSYEQFLFNTSMLVDYGVEALVDAFSRQIAGRIGGGRNMDHHVLHVAVDVIKESREMRLQPFNEYRKRFGMKPYTSFEEFTGDKEVAAELEELYGDIDALEFYPGLLLEKCLPNSIFGESMIEIGAPFSLKGLLGNPICSPEYWKPSTFGGEMGFNVVKTATLKKLVCLNTKTCPYVSFRVPDSHQDSEPTVQRPSTEL
ncbi:prostaglandin G/H synthase 1 isoform X3 [Nycticebus coucang]|uniref:prostaglandin G/H synthase 1 isoform X3 n=1 Tax=Nycticebus coucang TaxID=9470 RepID=UPI00234C5138|nr:prostaglandin G/H synthase 1 isoform X3 [Nycticebus coucang]